MSTQETNKVVLDKIAALYTSIFEHDGFGEIRVEMKILHSKKKEVIIHCGKQYRYVVDYKNNISKTSNIIKPANNTNTDKPLSIEMA